MGLQTCGSVWLCPTCAQKIAEGRRQELQQAAVTGMGRRGEQELSGQNLRLARQAESDTPVYLFEVFTPNEYRYAGRVELAGEVQHESQPDDQGQTRLVYVFPLRLSTLLCYTIIVMDCLVWFWPNPSLGTTIAARRSITF
jgi:hypothetical protein